MFRWSGKVARRARVRRVVSTDPSRPETEAAPFFPEPGASIYRAPAERVVVEPPPAPPLDARKKVVVSRPDAPAGSPAPHPAALTAEDLYTLAGESAPIAARFPRALGSVLLALGGWSVWVSLTVLLHGGRYGFRGVVSGPPLALLGLYLLVFRCPLDRRTGRPTEAWRVGAGVTFAAGLAIGLALFTVLGTR